MTTLKLHTPDFTAANIAKLAELFPQCVTESTDSNGEPKRAIDFDLLRQELSGSVVEGAQERYQLNWVGKREALLTANAPIAKTLRPNRADSVNFDTTENLYIEGDNLDALKLLQETYLNQVKMIYIDPPYNTGNDFIYEDDFAEDTDSYLIRSNQTDADGNRLVANTEANGRFHSDWLSMMYSRLRLARNLLRDDGVIFISIDDNEQANLKRLCDEVFGEENFINIVSVNMKNVAGASGGGEDKRLKKNCEFILNYAKNYTFMSVFKNTFEYTEIYEAVQSYKKEGKSWHYSSILLEAGEKIYVGSVADGDGNEIKIYKRPNAIVKSVKQVMNDEEISEKDVYYHYGARIFEAKDAQSSIRTRVIDAKKLYLINEDILSIEYIPKTGRNKGVLYEQFYKGDKCRLFAWLSDISETIDDVLYKKEKQGTYWDFTSHINNLTKEGDVVFPNGKKPTALIRRISEMATSENDIILDFFSGSATTAHAVMQLNAEDGGQRKFIMVQIPEPCAEKSEAYKAGFATIAEIGKERIRRAGQKIKTEHADKLHIGKLDIGFRVLKIDSSNMHDVYYTPDQTRQTTLLGLVDNVRADRTDEDLLFQVLLDWGVDLTLPIRQETLAGQTVFIVTNKGVNEIAACFDRQGGITEDFIRQLAAFKPSRAVFCDAGFASDSVKINVNQLFKLLSPPTKLKTM
jgi:adenine-specific DNA-methyltransferase